MRSKTGYRYALILLAVLLLSPSAGYPGEKPEAGAKLQLSLRIAKARKARGKIGYFMSVARQHKNRRPAIAPPPSSAR